MSRGQASQGYIDKVLLPNIAWALWLLIPITFVGFYPSYFSTLKAPLIIHVHGALMVLWLATVIIQPWLIKLHKIKWHRSLGKLSYVLMPTILLVGYFVLRYGYLRVLAGDVVAPPDYYPEAASADSKAADFIVIGSLYFFWLLTYYTLGILFKKKIQAHATFMLAAALTILGPSGDRFLGYLYYGLGWEFNAFAENFTFGIIFLIFGALLVYHHKHKLDLWPTITVLVLQLIGVFLFHKMPFHPSWDGLAKMLFSPN
ncbi:hypothetical protein [Cecembia rubra]|uniref:Uncharacterized protein n=1 Tax=Cecembia rubra TaxID=1485585 RepID=A0A2P8DYP4_9BACT|nr:hypothetical protein [Cecembia rubra]PSL02344.1 hypothetical protein CLV48_110127 [Cecembia rubra]